MKHLIAVKPDSTGQYVAHAVGLPELQARAATVAKAVDQVETLLSQWVRAGQLILVDVPDPNPLLKWAGSIDASDPDEQDYLEELARMRRQDLEETLQEYEQECRNSSSTPTT